MHTRVTTLHSSSRATRLYYPDIHVHTERRLGLITTESSNPQYHTPFILRANHEQMCIPRFLPLHSSMFQSCNLSPPSAK